MKLLLSLTIYFGPIPSVHSLKSEMIIVLFLLVLCICSFSCNIMLEMVLHVEKSPKPFASALVSVLLAFIPLCFLEYGSNQNRSSGWHWLQQVSFLPHISRNLVSTSNSVTDQSHIYKASTASDAASSFWCGFFPFPGWENLGHSLYFSYSRQLSRFALSRASFYLELKLKEGTSSLCAYPHWWLLASLTTQLIGSGLKIWFGADFCVRPSRKKHGTASQLGWSALSNSIMDVGLFVDQVFYSATETHVAWFVFFFCPGWRRIANPDGGWPLGSAALSSLHVCNSVLHLSICHYGCV